MAAFPDRRISRNRKGLKGMSNEPHELEAFVHREGAGPKAVRVPAEATLAEVLAKAGVGHQPDLYSTLR